MPTFEIITPTSAPKPLTAAGRLVARMREYESYLASINKGQVGKLVPERGETTHGLELRIVRAARRIGKAAETWSANGIVYFRITGPAASPSRAQAQRDATRRTGRGRSDGPDSGEHARTSRFN